MLFDNYIGRKRDVVGGILAGLLTVGFVAAKAVAGLALGPKRYLTVTFQNSSRLTKSGLERRETV